MELAVHQDKILNSIEKFKADEKTRASDAAGTRQEIGKLCELTGVNNKAFAMIRQLDKASEERRDDILRSFDALRDIMEASWAGQRTPDMLDGDEPEEAGEAEAETADAAPEADEVEIEGETAEGDPELAAEAEEFEAQADQVVTPIDFGGARA